MENIFGIFVTVCGIYCLYGYYLAKVKKEIAKSILLPKDVDAKDCKDLEGYCREVRLPLLVLGTAAAVQGPIDIYQASAGGAGRLSWVMFAILAVALIWFAVTIRKTNKKYFD